MMKALLSCAGICLCALLLAVGARGSPSPAEKRVFDELNQERQKAGLPALEWNELAAEAARHHAALLAQNAKLSHQFTGEPSLAERLGTVGVRFTRAGENVARTEHIEDIHPALMSSPGHRANILNPHYNAAGIGVVEQSGRVYAAEDFVFQVPVYTEADFDSAFAEGFNLARRAKGMREIEARPDPYLRELACATDGDALKLSGNFSAQYLVVFNSSEPRRLPEQLMKAAGSPAYQHLSFGACFRPDKEHGYGNFWVVAAFSGS